MDIFWDVAFHYLVGMFMAIVSFNITERVEYLRNHKVLWFLLSFALAMGLLGIFFLFENAYKLLLFLAE